MAFLGALGGAGAGAGGAAAGGTAAGAGMAGSAAAGLGTAGGLGLGGAAATPALSMAGGAAGSTLASGALGAGIPAIGAGSSGLTAAGLGGGGISTAGGIAPQLTQGAASPTWYTQMFDKAQQVGDYGSKQGNDKAGGKKQPDLVADAPVGSVRARPAYDASGSNAQIASILQSIFGGMS